MGEAKRRKQLSLTDRQLITNNQLLEERELYRKYESRKLKPDLGMALFPEYLHSIVVDIYDYQIESDPIFGTGIIGKVSCVNFVDFDIPMPELALMDTEGYSVTIALGKNQKQIDLAISLQEEADLTLIVAPQYKYLKKVTNEWILPLIPANLMQDKFERDLY
jgi:hypothetical protein